MIVKVCKRVGNVRGMVSYLMGPGKDRVHTNQHTVAGTINYAEPDSPQLRRQLTSDLELHSKLHPGVEIKGGAVYHVVLSLSAEEKPLTDATWQQISTEFMDRMGMTGTGGKSTMWTVIRHGLSEKGNDHVHIVANLIRQDGTKVSLHNDMIRASKIVRELERKHGLQVVAGRGPGGNAQPYTGGEIGRSQRGGKPIERVELERRIRAHAESSTGEAEFVRRVRADGIEARPYRKEGKVLGYAVRLPGGALWYGGGKLAKDLSLPALRARWAQAERHTTSAAHEWEKGTTNAPVTKYGAETRPNIPGRAKVLGELEQFRHQVQQARTLAQIRGTSRTLSGALAAGSRVDPALGKPARDTGAWAPRRGASGRIDLISVTALLMAASRPGSRAADILLAREVTKALMELYKLHRMRAQVVHARTTTKGAPRVTAPSDGLDEELEGIAQVGAVAVATGAQVWAQSQQEQLEKEAARSGNRSVKWTDPETGQQVEIEVPVGTGSAKWRNAPMTDKQDQTLHAIAGRAGIEVTELKLGDVSYGTLTAGQASDLIDALGSPRYGSRGDAEHTLYQGGGATATKTKTPAQQYAQTPQAKGPGAPNKNMNVPKI